jgi:hypothetical protein
MGALTQTDRYLADLPRGADAYPECVVKASVFRNFFAERDVGPLLRALPPELAAVLREPPPPSSWMSEVRATAIYLASAETIFTERSFVAHAYKSNYALFDSAMYRVLFRLVGTRRLLSKAADNWTHFHRGTTLTTVVFDEDHKRSELRIDAPPHHVPPLLAEGYGTALRAAVEIAGGADVRAIVTLASSTQTTIAVRWT